MTTNTISLKDIELAATTYAKAFYKRSKNTSRQSQGLLHSDMKRAEERLLGLVRKYYKERHSDE